MIKSLESLKKEEIIDCLHEAFSDYSIPMKMPYDYWIKRWKAAKIDYSLSYGYFDKEQLVGFVLHGISERYGKKSFFNMGTGVIPSHRRQRLVQKIYDYALLELKNNNCSQGLLEVIQDNQKAIKAYRNVGFKITENLISFKSPKDHSPNNQDSKLTQVEMYNLNDYKKLLHHMLSWEHTRQTIESCPEEFDCYEWKDNNKLKGFILIKKSNKSITQFGVLDNDWNKYGQEFFGMVSNIFSEYKMININDKDKSLISFFKSNDYPIFVKQYEMKLDM